jgi:hypothetical protein
MASTDIEPNADSILESLECATEECKLDPRRIGQTIHLPHQGEVWVSGDMHDHRRNFEKFVAAADLGNNPQRHIVLHELIHGDHYDADGAEGSWRILVRAAEVKCDHPRQVHFLLANHDLAQIYGEGILKGGVSVCEGFNKGVRRDFKDKATSIQVAITEFLLSYPLAIRTHNGVFISHSLPAEEEIPDFDYTVFDRELTGADYKRRTGPVYQLVWGRKMSGQAVARFADRVKAKVLITGHQPQESGYATVGNRMLILASDHNQGVYLPLSLSEEYDFDKVVRQIQKFIAMNMPEEDEGQGRVRLEL